MNKFSKLFSEIRSRIVSALHTGHLRAGDRLPSVRVLAEELGADPRAVMRVYHLLEEQGLVEVRGRSGVYLVEQKVVGERMLAETARWLADEVLTEALQRRIPVPELPQLVRRCTATVKVRCAVLDAVRDQREAVAEELGSDFGMEAHPLVLPAPPAELTGLDDDLREVDLLVTTTFHAPEVLALAQRLDMPAVVVHFNPLLVRELEQRLADGPVTFVVLDPLYRERLRATFGPNVRTILLDDTRALAGLAPGQPVVVSRAARERAEHLNLDSVLPPHVPVISPESSREIARWLIHINVQAEEELSRTRA